MRRPGPKIKTLNPLKKCPRGPAGPGRRAQTPAGRLSQESGRAALADRARRLSQLHRGPGLGERAAAEGTGPAQVPPQQPGTWAICRGRPRPARPLHPLQTRGRLGGHVSATARCSPPGRTRSRPGTLEEQRCLEGIQQSRGAGGVPAKRLTSFGLCPSWPWSFSFGPGAQALQERGMDEGRVWRRAGDPGEAGDPAGAPGPTAGPAGGRLRRGARSGGGRPTGRTAAPRRDAPEGARAASGVCLARPGPGPAAAAPRRERARPGTRGSDGWRRRTPGPRGADPRAGGG